MEWTNLHSGKFQRIGYDAEIKQLHVKLHDGRYIIFYEVRESDYVGMFSSSNMNDYFDTNIRGRFPEEEVYSRSSENEA
ncbi:KTSC domain-containing protein [Alkalicoccus urumqiensis]|uniref:KTSC domain-containing protein n=1 Tax=Alkalicoccus urumqiensis TaxID=1548213 RepID=A0A2P6MEY1_ALKUR|nr:KTSC domain-containing protein [Alkalicoccus urumqiensis]PRO64875.1 hypothetical protein C6I21_12055 [Alkalicoccus urumqiensis]